MNPSLMTPVERVVRPVHAPMSSKMRMRNELYSHLEQIYQEEFSATHDETSALERSLARFGDLDEIREQLQLGISKPLQWVDRLDESFSRRAGESHLAFAVRNSFRVGAVFFVQLIVILLLAALGLSTVRESAWLIAPYFLILSLTAASVTFVVLQIAQPLVDRPVGALSKWELIRGATLFGVAAAVAEAVLLFGGRIFSEWELPSHLFPLMGMAFVGAAVMFSVVIFLFRNELSQISEWRELEI
ncbi:hypothetical protein KOR42_11670 [Thalassoglobus neptunius]|uniref:Uncharacterized protein n=1 Tax=Thalassoglobus neptunius TaxID=1938619 RepID=A0A5C5X4I5_9PLAN|nr:hypothetical protein [Thalassoglobus neptunius]TWT57800.1 hypothetical protein KOR42_11670 [Thalassoglobus neptunius]